MRRLIQIVGGVALACLAGEVLGQAAEPSVRVEPAPPPKREPIGPAFDSDAALPAHADKVASYTLRATLDPVKHTILGQGTIVWRNASRAPQTELWLHLYLNGFKSERTVFGRFAGADGFRSGAGLGERGRIDVKRFSVREAGGDLWDAADKTSPGDPEDETDIRVPLVQPVPPGASLTIDVEWEAHLPSITLRTGHYGGFHMAAQWFPKLARLEPDGRWAHFTFHHLSEFYADYGSYDVTIDTPEAVVVGATGKLESEVRDGGRAVRRFTQDDVHDFAFAAWDRFREISAQTRDGVAVRLLYPPGHEAIAGVELEMIRYGLDYFGAAYGRYPYGTLTVVHPPHGAGEAGGMEYPTLITTGGSWAFPWSGVRFPELLTIHELGHQWFYGLVGSDEHAFPFLDEGVNSYAEVDALEHRFPGESLVHAPGARVGIAAGNRAGSIDAVANAPVAQGAHEFLTGADYGSLVYRRTATILSTLGNVYGEDRVRKAIGRYARRHRFGHPGPEQLEQAVAEVVGEDAAAQLHAALFDRATVDYAIGQLASEADGAGGYRGSVLVRRRGALVFPVEIDLVREDGSTERVTWDGKGSSALLPYAGKLRLVGAVVDPAHRVLLDDDLSNNAWASRRQRISTGALDRLTFAAEALLSGILP